MKIRYSSSFLLLILLVSKSYASSELDISGQNPDKILAQNNKNILTFSSSSLFGGQNQSVDLSIFRSANYVAEGTYIVDTTVNDRSIGELKLLFKHLDANPTAVLCIDTDMLKRLDLQSHYLNSLTKKDCLTIKDISPDAYYDFDLSTQKIAIYIPQKFVVNRPKGYIDPVLFDSGITSAFVGYNANFNQNDQEDSKYLALTAGLNLNGWYFRHAGNFDSKDSGLGTYRSYQNVLYRDITAINARISSGQFNTSSLQTESLPINLAISLHASEQEKRTTIMPINASYCLHEVVECAGRYAQNTKRQVTYEYIMLAAVNDSLEDAAKLVSLLRGQLACVNLIPANNVQEYGLQKSPLTQVKAFQEYLQKNNIPVTIRKEMGADINAACGQLRNKIEELE